MESLRASGSSAISASAASSVPFCLSLSFLESPVLASYGRMPAGEKEEREDEKVRNCCDLAELLVLARSGSA